MDPVPAHKTPNSRKQTHKPRPLQQRTGRHSPAYLPYRQLFHLFAQLVLLQVGRGGGAEEGRKRQAIEVG